MLLALVALGGCGSESELRPDPLAGLVEPAHAHAPAPDPAPLAAPPLAARARAPAPTGARVAAIDVERTLATTPARGQPTGVRVVLALEGTAELGRQDYPADASLPRRIVLTLAGTSLAEGVDALTPVGRGGLTRVRATSDGDVTRVAFDLEPDATPRVRMLPDPARIVVDVSVPDPNAPAAGRPPVHLVLLDPGHGGDDFGARAFRLRESDLTLDLAMRTRDALLRRRPDIRVVLTREDDTFVSLEQRTAMANAMGADLFVSIHLNAAWEPVDHGGVTTFVLDTTNDRQALRLAARENGTSTGEVTELSRILAGLQRGEQSAASSVLADRIHFATLSAGRRVIPHLHDRGVRPAMFAVLVGATMPAVLVEAAFLTREDEASALRTERYRDTLAGGIADGIARYAAPPE